MKAGSLYQLTNFIVDCTILCIIKEIFKSIVSLPCQVEKICLEKVSKLISLNPNFIIIPILRDGHFNLCILNILSRDFIFIDSLSDFTGKEHYDHFVSLL